MLKALYYQHCVFRMQTHRPNNRTENCWAERSLFYAVPLCFVNSDRSYLGKLSWFWSAVSLVGHCHYIALLVLVSNMS